MVTMVSFEGIRSQCVPLAENLSNWSVWTIKTLPLLNARKEHAAERIAHDAKVNHSESLALGKAWGYKHLGRIHFSGGL